MRRITMSLFSRKNKQEEASVVRASDKVVFEQIIEDDNKLLEMADKLKAGNPLIIDFSKIDTDISLNKFLAFLSGVTYALDGKVITINETIFAFARKIDFLDGSLQELIDSIPR